MTAPKKGHPRPDRFAGLSPLQLGWIMLASLQYVKDARRGEANPVGLVAAYIDGQEAAAILDKRHLRLSPKQDEIKQAIQRGTITTDDRAAIEDAFDTIPTGTLCKLSEAEIVQTLGDTTSDFALAATRRLELSLLDMAPEVDFDKDPEEPGDLP